MKKMFGIKILLISCILLPAVCFAQKPAGIYQLTGVMETAAGFKLNTDSTFEFYFSYGALDRYGSGRWLQQGDSVILNSKPWPGKDFRIVSASVRPGKKMVFELAEKNSMLLPFVYVTSYKNGKQTTVKTNSHGLAYSDIPAPDSIGVQFEFTPERISVFKPAKPGVNYFSFAIEKWITEVFFYNTVLSIGKDELKGKLFLLGEKEYLFKKEN